MKRPGTLAAGAWMFAGATIVGCSSEAADRPPVPEVELPTATETTMDNLFDGEPVEGILRGIVVTDSGEAFVNPPADTRLPAAATAAVGRPTLVDYVRIGAQDTLSVDEVASVHYANIADANVAGIRDRHDVFVAWRTEVDTLGSLDGGWPCLPDYGIVGAGFPNYELAIQARDKTIDC